MWEYRPNGAKRSRRRKELVGKARSQGSTPNSVLRGGPDDGKPAARAHGSATNVIEGRAVADIVNNAGFVAAKSAVVIGGEALVVQSVRQPDPVGRGTLT